MNKDLNKENPIPEDFWNELSDEEKDALAKAQAEASEEFQNYDEWKEMDEEYFEHLRQRFDKGPDEIGPLVWKSYQNKFLPMR